MNARTAPRPATVTTEEADRLLSICLSGERGHLAALVRGWVPLSASELQVQGTPDALRELALLCRDVGARCIERSRLMAAYGGAHADVSSLVAQGDSWMGLSNRLGAC